MKHAVEFKVAPSEGSIMNEKVTTSAPSIEQAWTITGSALVGICIPIFIYLRSGSTSIFQSKDASPQDDAGISLAFWGIMLTSIGLVILGALALRYKRQGFGQDGFNWPRFSKVEGDARDGLVAGAVLAVFTLVPVSTLVGSLIVYSKSRISLWDANLPLADGFITSRWAAVQTACNNEPCFRMHPLDGHPPDAIQWFTWINDPAIVVALGFAIFFWTRWFFSVAKAGRADVSAVQ